MTPRTLQDWIDLLLDASRTQWLLRAGTVLAPIVSVLAAAAASPGWWPPGTALVAVLAIAAALRPDTHFALSVAIVCAWHWAAIDADVASGWLPLAAVALLVFHATVALAASLPSGTAVPNELVMRWAARTGVAAGITVGVWLAVALLDRRELPGNGLLTGLALAVIGITALAVRARSLRALDPGETVIRR
ncbi:MAG: hypothetical protein AAGD18_13155 [Actinomycetota bacterium]